MSTLVAAVVLFSMWLAWGGLSWRRTLAVAQHFDGVSALSRFLLSAGALALSGAALIGGWLVATALSPGAEVIGAADFAVFLVSGALFVNLQMFGAGLLWRTGTQVTSGAAAASKSRNDHNRQDGEQE